MQAGLKFFIYCSHLLISSHPLVVILHVAVSRSLHAVINRELVPEPVIPWRTVSTCCENAKFILWRIRAIFSH